MVPIAGLCYCIVWATDDKEKCTDRLVYEKIAL
jgi:hypothetical protein